MFIRVPIKILTGNSWQQSVGNFCWLHGDRNYRLLGRRKSFIVITLELVTISCNTDFWPKNTIAENPIHR